MPDCRRSLGILLLLAILLPSLFIASGAWCGEPKSWSGVDEAVVEKIAKEHGREAKAPLLNPAGDLLLFAFLSAGFVGGFAAGYYWRDLVKKDRQG